MTETELIDRIAELQKEQIRLECRLSQIQQKVLALQDRIGRGEDDTL